MVSAKRFYQMLTRKKHVEDNELLEDTNLKRALTLLDLIALGVGSTLGVGVYVLAGSLAKTVAGPAVVISFLIAGVASAFAGICYAEFASRVPRAGSAYIYSYVCVGEFVAFIIGWNLILEYVVGTASVTRGLSGYIDEMCDQCISTALTEWLPMQSDFVADFPDFFSLGLAIFFSLVVAFGVKESSTFNNVFTTLNLAVVSYVIICGSFLADIDNWRIDKEAIEPEYQAEAGEGGFAPFGLTGVISAAASCFYGFVGFDCVATTGEEAQNPQRNIPIAIVVSLSIIFLAYFGISTVLTLMLPYYMQDEEAPIPVAFEYYGWYVAFWIVTVGAIFGLCASLMGGLFPLPRVMYAMSKDGIIFKIFGKVHPKTQTPVISTLLGGLLIGLLATIFDLQQLVDMLSIGTLMAYSIVAACVLLLRYQAGDAREYHEIVKYDKMKISVFQQLFNLKRLKYPSTLSSDIVTWAVLLHIVLCFAFGAVIRFSGQHVLDAEAWALFLFILFGVLLLLNLLIITLQPTSKKKLNFRVPFVPLVPALSMFINFYLMLSLSAATWLRFLVWMAIGFAIYFGYGVWHSLEPIKEVVNRKTSSVVEGTENKAFESGQ